MKKKIILWSAFLALLAIFVLAAGDLGISPSSATLTFDDLSETESAVLRLTNTNALDDLRITSYELKGFTGAKYSIPSSAFSFNRSGFVLPADTSEDVKLTVDLSGTNAYAQTYTGLVNVTTNDTQSYAKMDLNLVVRGFPEITMADLASTIAKGQSKNLTLTINDVGNTDETASLTVTKLVGTNSANEIAASNIQFTPSSVKVNYNGQNTSTVKVSVPSGAEEDVYTGTITATYGARNAAYVTKQENATLTITVNSPTGSILIYNFTLGGPDQQRSNPDQDFEVYTTSDVEIENVGTLTLTNITFSTNADTHKYNVSFSGYATTLAPGAKTTATIRARVPEDLDAVNDDLEEAAMKIATLTATANAGGSQVSTTEDMHMQAKNKLGIDDADVAINDESEDDLDDGDTIEDIKPGDSMVITVVAENNYKDNDEENIEIQDIEFNVRINEDDLDVDEDGDINDIAPEEREEGSVSFDIDEDADQGTYSGTISVKGDDENGAKHGLKWEFELKIEREKHEVSIVSISLTPSTVSCNRDVQIKVKAENTGRSNEDSAVIRIQSSALGIDEQYTGLEIDKEDDVSKTLSFTVADSVASGTYPITVTTYYDDDEESDEDTADLVVSGCGEQEEEEEEEEEEVPEETEVDTQPTGGSTTPTGATTATTTGAGSQLKLPFSDSNWYMILLLGLNVVVVIVIIGLIIKFLFK